MTFRDQFFDNHNIVSGISIHEYIRRTSPDIPCDSKSTKHEGEIGTDS